MHYNADSLPFELEFFTDDSAFNTKRVKEYWGKNEVSPRSTQDLLQIKEGIQIGVRLYAKEGFEPDSGAKVVLQSGTYDEDGKQIELNVPLTDRYCNDYLFKNEKNQVFPWRLGVYFFEVHYGDYTYASAVFVSPIHLTTEQVQHMHLLLEREIEGICYELIYTSKSIGNEHEFLESKSYYDYVLRLMNEKERVNAAISYVQRNLLTQVKTAYAKQPFQQKVDHKSLRWKEIRGNTFELNKKKVLSSDIPQNRWLKHVLTSWKQELIQVQKQIEDDCKMQLNVIRVKEEEKKLNEERKKTLWNEREISQESKDSMKSKTFRLEDEIKKAGRQFGVLNRWNYMVENIIGRFAFVVYSTELNEVPSGRKKPQLKERNYRLISDLYEEGRKVLFGEMKSNHVVQILKPTWKIYEQFVFFQVVDILRKHGFTVSDACDLDVLRELQSGYCMVMESEDLLVHIWYDKLIYLREDAIATGEAFFSTRLIQPDIRIDLYIKGDQPVFLSTIALDAKHRKYKSLHNQNFTSIVFTQLSKYNNIYFLGKNTAQSRRRSVVSSVICVYSRDRDAPIKQEEIPLVFIQLFPELDQDQITGYPELRAEITDWIDENKTSFL
jgi:hypothetical protein